MRASDFYMELACKELGKITHLSAEEHLELLKECNMEKIDKYIDIASPLQSAIDGIIEGIMDVQGVHYEFDYLVDLEENRFNLELDGEDYKIYLLYDDEERGDFPKLINAFREELGNESSAAFHEIIMTAMEEMHHHWVMVNTNRFFDINQRDRQFMFMPFDMIGWQEAERYFMIIEPIIADLGLDDIVKRESIFSKYQSWVRRAHHGWGKDKVRYEILKVKNCSTIIQKALKADDKMLERVTLQVFKRLTQA